MYNRDDFRARNFAQENCPLCTGERLWLHTHGRMLLVPTANPKDRAYGCDSRRPNFYHAIGMDTRGNPVCTCEHGQKQARKRSYLDLLTDCSHISWVRIFAARGYKPLEAKRLHGHLIVLESVGDELELEV